MRKGTEIKNIISVCESFKILPDIKKCEAETLRELIDEMKLYNSHHTNYCFSDYYVGFTINQISKEFDLLRFGEKTIINIELKSEYNEEKIYNQMKKNEYYLKFAKKKIEIYTYIKGLGLYTLNTKEDRIEKVNIEELVNKLKSQKVLYNIDLDSIFKPKNYLVSPFNKTEEFLRGEYFLTNEQNNIKKEILKDIQKSRSDIICINAGAGTGKTLLMYDIAKEINKEPYIPNIIHCGNLNDGHKKINDQSKNLNISEIKGYGYFPLNKNVGNQIIIIDEAHRIREAQLDEIIKKCIENSNIIIFGYDPKQALKRNEDLNIFEHIKSHYRKLILKEYNLKGKIRSNKEIANFIKNLIKIRKDIVQTYDNISIEYHTDLYEIKIYLDYLEANDWKAITFTPSQYDKECIDEISEFNVCKAHEVIGQEFDKVVFVMNNSFKYSDNDKLTVKYTYYSLSGMMYQIVTRAVSKLKIIVYNNPELYEKLVKIKNGEYITIHKQEKLEIEKDDKYMIRLTEEDRMQERQEGIQEGIEKSINIVIETFKELNLCENDIIKILINKFKLTPEQVRKYLR